MSEEITHYGQLNGVELLEKFYKVQVVPLEDISTYAKQNTLIYKIIHEIIPEIKAEKIQFFIVPLPLNKDGIYWTDYAHSYIKEIYGDTHVDYMKKQHMIMTIYLDESKDINFRRNISLNFQLSRMNQVKVENILRRDLKDHFKWNGNSNYIMEIRY